MENVHNRCSDSLKVVLGNTVAKGRPQVIDINKSKYAKLSFFSYLDRSIRQPLSRMPEHLLISRRHLKLLPQEDFYEQD